MSFVGMFHSNKCYYHSLYSALISIYIFSQLNISHILVISIISKIIEQYYLFIVVSIQYAQICAS